MDWFLCDRDLRHERVKNRFLLEDFNASKEILQNLTSQRFAEIPKTAEISKIWYRKFTISACSES